MHKRRRGEGGVEKINPSKGSNEINAIIAGLTSSVGRHRVPLSYRPGCQPPAAFTEPIVFITESSEQKKKINNRKNTHIGSAERFLSDTCKCKIS